MLPRRTPGLAGLNLFDRKIEPRALNVE